MNMFTFCIFFSNPRICKLQAAIVTSNDWVNRPIRSMGYVSARSVLTLERYELKLLQTYRLGRVCLEIDLIQVSLPTSAPSNSSVFLEYVRAVS